MIKITTDDNIWNNSYLNKKSFTLLGTLLFVTAISASMSLLLVSTNILLIAIISAKISSAFSLKPSRFRSSRHFCRIWWNGDSKQKVIISLIWSLSWPTLKINLSSSSSSLSVLLQRELDLMKILWHSLSWRQVVFFKMKND